MSIDLEAIYKEAQYIIDKSKHNKAREELDEAIRKQDFEKAARIRDLWSSTLGDKWHTITSKFNSNSEAVRMASYLMLTLEEIKRLNSILPPQEQRHIGPGQGNWSVFAQEVVIQRDEAIIERDKAIDCLSKIRDQINILLQR